MDTHITKESFEDLYNNTYKNVLRYTICHCRNIDDVNDIIQDTYTELYRKVVDRKHIKLEKPENYVIGIAKNKLKKYYGMLKYTIPVDLEEKNFIHMDNESIDIESDLITKENVLQVWNYLKGKSEIIAKIFYLYYVIELPIKTIAVDLEISESNVKNYLYRTKKKLQEMYKKGDGQNVKQ